MRKYNEILRNALESGKEFEELTEIEKMVLAMKRSIEEIKVETDEVRKELLGMLIGKLSIDLKEMGIDFN